MYSSTKLQIPKVSSEDPSEQMRRCLFQIIFKYFYRMEYHFSFCYPSYTKTPIYGICLFHYFTFFIVDRFVSTKKYYYKDQFAILFHSFVKF
jgi:hypothetical protein